MRKNVYYPLMLSIIVSILVACEGPAGEKGPVGPQGEKGAAGAKGDAATARVYATEWINVKKQDLVNRYDKAGRFITTGFSGGDALSRITQNVIDTGIVLAYVRKSSDKTKIITLPSVIDFGSSGENLQQVYTLMLSPQKASCIIEFTKNVADISKYLQDEEYRFIVIPDLVKLRINNTQSLDYETVKKMYNLTD